MNGTLVDRLLSKMAGNAPNFPWRSEAGKFPSDVRHPSVLSWFSTAEDKSFPEAAGIGSGIGDSSFLNYSDINPNLTHNRVLRLLLSSLHQKVLFFHVQLHIFSPAEREIIVQILPNFQSRRKHSSLHSIQQVLPSCPKSKIPSP